MGQDGHKNDETQPARRSAEAGDGPRAAERFREVDDGPTREEPVLGGGFDDGPTREEPVLGGGFDDGPTREEPVLGEATQPPQPNDGPTRAEPVSGFATDATQAAKVVVGSAIGPGASQEHTQPSAIDPLAPPSEPAKAPPPRVLASAAVAGPVRSTAKPSPRPTASPTARADGDPCAPEASAGKKVLRVMGRIAKWSTIVLAVSAILGAAAVVLVIRHYEAGLPSVQTLRSGYDPPQVTQVKARNGTLLANIFVERRTVIGFDEIPKHAKLAFLAAEDASFYEHEGLDYFGMLRALVANLRAGGTRQGGSTITQQVVKNVLLEPDRTYQRKIRETILARRLEQHLSKDEIFALYLNQIYLGHGRYGIEEASRYYFGKHASELDLDEAALLAGLVAAPERYSPRKSPEKALLRRGYVLAQMQRKGFITREVYLQARDKPLRLEPAMEAESDLAPEVVALVKKLLRDALGGRKDSGGYLVITSIDPALQALGRKAVRENLRAYAKRQKLAPPFTLKRRRLWGDPFEGTPKRYGIYTGVVVGMDDQAGTIDVRVGSVVGRVFLTQEERYNPQRLPPSKFVEDGASLRVGVMGDPGDADTPPQLRLELGPQSALVAIDVRTREVRALVGSFEALAGGLDRATRARRQPGSAFKPFVYSYALESRRFSPATTVEVPEKGGSGTRLLRVREAISESNNAAAQRIFQEAGPANIVQWARLLGIESELRPTPSLALGAYEVRPLEIANAYASFASGGIYAPPVVVKEIRGPGGQDVPLPKRPPKRRVMEEEVAYLTTSLLRSVVESGTGRRARALGRPVAGKTGTTNDAKDAWFVGYSPDLVTAVWVGYDDALPLGWGESGATTALPAWVEFMKAAHADHPVTEFARPSKILTARIDPATGQLAYVGQEDAIEEEFLDGTVPEEMASPDAGADAAPEDEVDAGVGALQPDASAVPTPAEQADAGVPEPPDEPPPF